MSGMMEVPILHNFKISSLFCLFECSIENEFTISKKLLLWLFASYFINIGIVHRDIAVILAV